MHFTKTDDDGRRYRERHINGKSYRYYADEGRRLGTVWTDIPAMVANTPLRKEATGYPTQKPERLLERIIRAASDEGDTVADLMCGSGTTLVVAARLGRRGIGGDTSDVAIETARRRLDDAGVDYRFAAVSARANNSASRMPRSDALPEPARS
jgi:site-specific DNA-methyltransferase (adenine-specific)